MNITSNIINTHELTNTEWVVLCEAENIIRNFYNAYHDEITLSSPFTGECVCINELPRVLGILSFFSENRKVEVSVD